MFEILVKGRNKKSNNNNRKKMLQQRRERKEGKLTFDVYSKKRPLVRGQAAP